MIFASSASVLFVRGRMGCGGGVIGYRISNSVTQSHTAGEDGWKTFVPKQIIGHCPCTVPGDRLAQKNSVCFIALQFLPRPPIPPGCEIRVHTNSNPATLRCFWNGKNNRLAGRRRYKWSTLTLSEGGGYFQHTFPPIYKGLQKGSTTWVLDDLIEIHKSPFFAVLNWGWEECPVWMLLRQSGLSKKVGERHLFNDTSFITL
ncbi:hypothetical protein CDAR_570241 [Caerostris darwini]|uniref:Uncharacterized protein n=1 Tax=Caerostris darwini TaxID=1538125 RepID=A0AAV4PEB8_9ARAC|nr:hypothetical protein CDAR_570241 [Caerostris darwini]